MPKEYTVTAGPRGASASEKASKTISIATFSEVKQAFANGKAPVAWESLEEFYMDAFAHMVVRVQAEIRRPEEVKTSRSKNPFLS